jgi:hypothetical protein
MARPLQLQLGDTTYAFQLEKVDRSKLYGYVDVEALDDKGRACRLTTLAGDGRTLVASTASALLSPDGEWLDRSKLTAVNPEGKPFQRVESTFNAPVALAKKAAIEEYLSHNIKSVYVLAPEGDPGPLAAELRAGTIYTFPFSFRGGLVPDQAFLLANPEGSLFLCLGQPTRLRFVGLEQTAVLTEELEAEAEEETMDFGML